MSDEVYECPLDDCDMPAAVVMEFNLTTFPSGSVRHIRLECFAGHGRVLPAYAAVAIPDEEAA